MAYYAVTIKPDPGAIGAGLEFQVRIWADSPNDANNKAVEIYGTGRVEVGNVTTATDLSIGNRKFAEENDPNFKIPDLPVDTGEFLEMAAPQAAFRRFLGTVGYDPTAISPTRQQQAAQAQYDPLSAMFVGEQVLGGIDPYGGTAPQRETQFANFLGNRPGALAYETGGTAAMPRATAGELADQLARFSALTGQTGPRTLYQQQAIAPQTVTQGRPLANIGLQALGQSISPLAAQYFSLPSQEELATRYLTDPGIGNYADFIRGQLGAGRINPLAGTAGAPTYVSSVV